MRVFMIVAVAILFGVIAYLASVLVRRLIAQQEAGPSSRRAREEPSVPDDIIEYDITYKTEYSRHPGAGYDWIVRAEAKLNGERYATSTEFGDTPEEALDRVKTSIRSVIRKQQKIDAKDGSTTTETFKM